jgi:hypothetical protein
MAMLKMLEMRETRIDFATKHHINTRGEKMDFVRFPHIKDLYNSVAFEIVLMGSVQSLKSEWAICDHFAAANSGLSVFFVLPKFEMRTTFVQNRVNRCVEQVPEYKKIIGNGFFDSVALKSFGRGVVKYVGSNVLADFKEFPADILYVEEVDQCDPDNVEFALDRLRASRYQYKRYLGNPTIKNNGIHKYYLKSDQREWWVPCKLCGIYSKVDWFATVVKEVVDGSGNIVDYVLRDTEWKTGIRRDIRLICPHCGGELERTSVKGEWRPENPDSSIEGYHISLLCSPLNSIQELWSKFRGALDDPGLMKQFFNSYLGLPYNAAGNRVTDTLLERCSRKGYKFIINPNSAHVYEHGSPGPCSMGIDVGAILDIRISEVLGSGFRKCVYIGKVKSQNFSEVYELIQAYNVEKVVIDAAPELMLAQDFQEQSPCDVWLCRYGGEGSDRTRKFNLNDRILTIDRTEALDRGYSQLRMGRNILPENYNAILSGKYVEEMCNPVREIVEDAKGNLKYEWTKGADRQDHQRHADVYDMLAAHLLAESTVGEVYVG